MIRALVLALCLATTTAHADVWQRAIDTTDATRDRYDAAMRNGDDFARRADAKSLNRDAVTRLVDQSIQAYAEASTIRPDQGEPYFRIASVLESYFTDCDPGRAMGITPATCPNARPTRVKEAMDPVRAKQTLEAWDEFEKRAPLDPRVSETRFSRAILRTKLIENSKDVELHLKGAMRDYEAVIDHADGLTMVSMEQVWGNLAETYMMLGKLEQAVDAYKIAIAKGGDVSTYYGAAVALDRDEREAEAMELIRAQGAPQFERFRRRFFDGEVFFVPKGEEFYYFAIVHEAFGYTNEAIANWRLFLRSGAHPQFQGRAKAHLDALLIKQKANPRPAPRPDLDELFGP